jgi:hypothetical protein
VKTVGCVSSELCRYSLITFPPSLFISLSLFQFSFAVNAAVLTGIVPSKLYSKFGPKKTILIGGLLLTAAHILAAFVLGSDLGKFLATVLLFVLGIAGGQGACIIFLAAMGAMLKQHSIICTSLVSLSLFVNL